MKYLWSVLAALLLTAVTLYLYGLPVLDFASAWSHYAIVTVISIAVTLLAERHLKHVAPWAAVVVLVLLGLWLHSAWLIYLGVGVLAALLAALVPSSAPRKASAGR